MIPICGRTGFTVLGFPVQRLVPPPKERRDSRSVSVPLPDSGWEVFSEEGGDWMFLSLRIRKRALPEDPSWFAEVLSERRDPTGGSVPNWGTDTVSIRSVPEDRVQNIPGKERFSDSVHTLCDRRQTLFGTVQALPG